MSLSQIAIFQDLNYQELELLQKVLIKHEAPQGTILFKEGDEGKEMYVVETGLINIFVTYDDGKELILTEVPSGSFFGEMSIIEQAPRSATCKTVQDSLLYSLSARDFNLFSSGYPQITTKIMIRMLQKTIDRLLKTGAFLSDMVQWGEDSRKRAITDPFTGLFNRRYLEDTLPTVVENAQRDQKPLAFVMFDLDRFGSLNTRFGQEFCDKMLLQISKTFQQVFTKEDILVRFGGDEFLFLFPHTTGPEAQKKCNDLCQAVRSLRFAEHPDLVVTCSLGFAIFPFQANTLEEMKEMADKALYEAKEHGRDQAVWTSEKRSPL